MFLLFSIAWFIISVFTGIFCWISLWRWLVRRGVSLRWYFISTAGYLEYKFFQWCKEHGESYSSRLWIHGIVGLNILFASAFFAHGMASYAESYPPQSRRTGWFPKESYVVGTYFVRYPFGTNTLVLSADHTFDQEVDIVKPHRITGRWLYSSDNGELTLDRGFDVTTSGTLNADFEATPKQMKTQIERVPLLRQYFLNFDRNYPLKKE